MQQEKFKFLNFNVGILGHVDSGKTSLAKSLSTVASTAAFDKNPQSQSRGITIDLGFSSFVVDSPSHISKVGFPKLQFTLVDCPGHASLIRTIIGGAQIIDAMILVIDVTKGMQTQTAECLIVGEILCKTLLVVLNKIDLIDETKREESIKKMSKKILNTLKNTKFKEACIVSVSASQTLPLNIDLLISNLKKLSYIPVRSQDDPFVLSADHCFGIKGQGTIITGTVLQGSISINENVEIPLLKLTKKVKSIQMYRQPVEKASQGDRIGLCVTQFDPKLLERSIVGFPGYIQCSYGFIALVHKIGYYKLPICSKSKFHISLGHDTVISNVTLFSSSDMFEQFDIDKEYPFQSELIDLLKADDNQIKHQYALIEFERLVPMRKNSIFIASKLDMDVHTNMCRLAFWGKILFPLLENYKKNILTKLKVYKDKMKEGTIERMNNENELIAKDLLKKGTDITLFTNLKVQLSTGEKASIEGNFGQSGKVKLRIWDHLKPETKAQLTDKKKLKKNDTNLGQIPIKVILKFKKYIFMPSKHFIQD